MAIDQDPPKFPYRNQQPDSSIPGQPDATENLSHTDQKVNLNLSPTLDALRQAASASQNPGQDLSHSRATEDTAERSELKDNSDPERFQPAPASPKREKSVFNMMVLGTLALTLTGGIFLWQITLRLQAVEDSLPASDGTLIVESPETTMSKSTDVEGSVQNSTRIETLEQQIHDLKQSLQSLKLDVNNQQNLQQYDESIESKLESIEAPLNHTEGASTTIEATKIKTAPVANSNADQAVPLTSPLPTPNIPTEEHRETGAPSLPLTTPVKDNQPGVKEPNLWFVNLGTFSERSSAEILNNRAKAIYAEVELITIKANKRSLFRVRASGFPSQHLAELKAQELQAALELGGVWVAEQGK
jgi:cell division septation protein DedD